MSLSLSWEVRDSTSAHPGLYFLAAKWPHPGDLAGILHSCTELRAVPDEWGPLTCQSRVAAYTSSWGLQFPPVTVISNCPFHFNLFLLPPLHALPQHTHTHTHTLTHDLFRYSVLSCSYSSLLPLQLLLSHISIIHNLLRSLANVASHIYNIIYCMYVYMYII